MSVARLKLEVVTVAGVFLLGIAASFIGPLTRTNTSAAAPREVAPVSERDLAPATSDEKASPAFPLPAPPVLV